MDFDRECFGGGKADKSVDMVIQGSVKDQRLHLYLLYVILFLYSCGIHAHDPEGRRIYWFVIMFLFPAWAIGVPILRPYGP
jgi:hypothetical protein